MPRDRTTAIPEKPSSLRRFSWMLHRIRAYLNEGVFIAAPPSPRPSLNRVALYGGLALGASGLQLLRVWSIQPLERLYGEDSFVFLAGAENHDAFSALTTTYNGYLQTSSRLVAEAAAKLPVDWWAGAMAICGALIVTGCAFVVWRTSVPYVRDRYLRAALAAMVILLGVAGPDVLGNVVNTIWFIAVACFWLLLWRPPNQIAATLTGVVLCLGALSTPAVLFLVPIWVMRSVAARDRRDLAIVLGFAIGAAVQLGFSADLVRFGSGDEVRTYTSPFYSAHHWDWNLIPAYLQRAVGGAVGGESVTGTLWVALGWPFLGVLVILLVAIVVWAFRTPATRVIVPLTVAISVALFLVSGYFRWNLGGSGFFWPSGTSTSTGSRYFITPALLLLTAVFMQVDAGLRASARSSWVRKPAFRVTVIGVIVVCALLSFHIDPLWETRPTWAVALDDARDYCLTTGAERVEVVTTDVPWVGRDILPLPCDALR